MNNYRIGGFTPPSYMLPMHPQATQFYPFRGPMVYSYTAPPQLMYYIPQEPPLEIKIRSQVHYYFSKENLICDNYMRKRMDDEGFVHIQFIANFNKLKALTRNIQLILNALRDSDVVELKGYEIRSRHMWRQFLMPIHLRIPFNPNLEDSTESSSSNQSV